MTLTPVFSGNVDVITQSARVKHTLGLLDETIKLNQQAIALDPLSLRPISNLGRALRSARRLDEAEAAYRQLLALNPQYPNGHSSLALVLVFRGQADEALTEVKLETVEAWRVYGLTIAYQALDRRDDADAMFEVFIQKLPRLRPIRSHRSTHFVTNLTSHSNGWHGAMCNAMSA